MTVGAQALDQGVAVDSRQRRFSGGINIGDDHRIGVVEAGAEAFEQVAQTAEAVGLHHRDHLTGRDAPGGAKHRGDFDRMMRIVVDDGDAVDFAGLGEPAVDSGEAGQGAAHHRVVDAHLAGDGDRGQGIQDVVLAEHRQEQIGQSAGGAGLAVGDDGVEADAADGRVEADARERPPAGLKP